MATTIGKLAAILTGNTKGFESAFKRAGKALSSFASTASGVAAGLGIFAAVNKVTNGLVGYTKSSFESIDVTAKLSDTLGIATEKLIGLQHAAGLSGVSNEDLASSLGKMMKVLGNAANGETSAIDALERLGLTIDALKGKSPDQVFGIIADRLNAIKDPSIKASAAMEIFGKSALGIFPLLKEGSSGLAIMQAEAEALGLTFNRLDAKKVEDANDSLTKVGEIITGIGQRIAIELAPFITYASNKLIEFGTQGGSVSAKVVSGFGYIATAIASATDYVSLLTAGFYGFRAGALQAIASVVKGVDWLAKSLSDFITDLTGVPLVAEGTFSDIAKALADEAGVEAAKFDQAMKDFRDGKNAKAVAAYFDDIRKKAEEAAAASLAIGSGAPDISGLNTITDAAQKAEKAIKKTTSSGSVEPQDVAPKLIAANSAEAAAMRVDMQNKAAGEKQREIAQAQLREQQRMSEFLGNIADSVTDFVNPIIARFA